MTAASGLVAFALVFVMFWAVRRRLGALMALWIGVLAGFASATSLLGTGGSVESLLTAAGLALSAFGLLIVRLMLARSVSLRLLGSYAEGRSLEGLAEHVGRRLEDVQRWRLASCEDGRYRLTRVGRLTASATAVLYALTRTRT